jgi:hypothetical protein
MRFLSWILALAGTVLAVSAVLIAANGSGHPWLAFAAGWVMTAIGLVGLLARACAFHIRIQNTHTPMQCARLLAARRHKSPLSTGIPLPIIFTRSVLSA